MRESPNPIVSTLARELGRLGGLKTAERGNDYFKRSSKLAVQARERKLQAKRKLIQKVLVAV
jgi:hypothetical protein